MKYYVVADVHAFYDELMSALTEKGFFEDKEPHKLIMLGDLFDRGKQAKELQQFVLDLMAKDEIILIRGNHEDLTLELVKNIEYWVDYPLQYTHHWSNGTVDTVCQLTGITATKIMFEPSVAVLRMRQTPYFKKIIPAMVNYFETSNNIFVHGWIPCQVMGRGNREDDIFLYQPDWREQSDAMWEKARWYNGMLVANNGVVEPNKTIVCGHWHSSYGHCRFEGNGPEFGEGADFSPYYGKGIIAMDSCTAASGIVNCIIIED